MTKHKNTGNRSETGRPSGSTKVRVNTAMASLAAAPAATRRIGPMPIVGIGASAGGLEALGQFFTNAAADSGMAFVVIQHLDPTHKGIMTELLQRTTTMAVRQAKNRMKVQPNHVYVIPPNKDMSLLRGVLHLFAPAAPRGLRLPIDFFLRSLADDRGEASIGVILSGMGSDGTLGLRAIKEKAGLTLVQAPKSAKFDGMPRSAIDAGVADIVASAEELPARIIGLLKRGLQIARTEAEPESQSRSGLDKIVILIRSQTGHDFSLYKKSTIHRRVERRMGVHQIDKIANYVRFLRENPKEVELLFRELLIGVTSFFRDPPAWTHLGKMVLPVMLKGSRAGRALRAWVPGCSTGEEAYSLAIVFREALEHVKHTGRISLQVFATDLDQAAIEKARQGFYPSNIAADVSPERLNKFFVTEDNGYRVGKEIREMVVFATQNLITDPPFTKLDILSCRNLLIYLTPEMQKSLLPLFHYTLNSGGVLILGNAETVGGFTDLFDAVDSKSRLYRKIDAAVLPGAVEFPTKNWPARSNEREVAAPSEPPASFQTLADQLLLHRYSPAAVLVNNRGDVVYVNGHIGKYLEPAAGKANWNIYAMARVGLRAELIRAFEKVARHGGKASLSGLTVGTNGGQQMVDLTIEAIVEPVSLRGMVVIAFFDVAPPPLSRKGRKVLKGTRTEKLELEAQRLNEELRSIREEMQSSQEELKSANEELQSANEELQSTNEELTTSKEEMQSLNEELQTVNAQLQSKVDDLSQTSSDMKNLLDSTEIATLFLDNALHVRRFTASVTRIIKLIPGDVGRPLDDIVSGLEYPQMQEDAQEVLRTLAFSEKQVPCRDGRWYAVRIMPYRTMDNVIDGLVITFSDISKAKKLEAELRGAREVP